MKLSLAIAAAIAALLYAIAKFYLPEFPFTPEQILQALVLLLGLLGIVVTEEQVRAFLVKRGFKGFIKSK